MRIMHLIGGGDVGGAKTHIMTLAAQLSRDGTLRLVSFREGAFAREAEAAGIDTVVLPGANLPSVFFRLKNEVRRFSPDILHCHGAKANMMGALLKRCLRLPVVSTVHSDYRLDYMHSMMKQAVFGTVNLLSLRYVDYRVTVAKELNRTLVKRGFDPEKIFTMHNGIDFSAPRPAVSRAAYFKGMGLEVEDGDAVAVTAARLTRVKDIPMLLRAFKRALESAPGLKLVVAGDGEEKAALVSLSRELGLEGRVVFPGWIKNMDEFFGAADINTLSSVSEAFPYSLLEGARGGCATVATDVGGVSEIILDGVTGLAAAAGDENTFAAHLARLGSDPALRQKLSGALYEKAEREFSITSMKEKQEEIYKVIARRAEKEKKEKRRSAVICGAYGRGNAGDDAILKAIVADMRSIDPDMPVFVASRLPKETRLTYRANSFYTFNVIKLWAVLRRSKLFVNGGGSLIQDVTSSRSLYYYLFTLKLAKALGCKVMMYGCGIGPVRGARNRKTAAGVINDAADVITLRDRVSFEELADMGVTKPVIRLAADPAMSIRPAPPALSDCALESEGIDPEGRYICFVLRSWKTAEPVQALVCAAEYAYYRFGLTPVFLSAEYPKDLPAAEKVAARLCCPCHVIRKPHGVETVIGILSRMRVVAAMRLHALIFAASNGVPVVGISYDVKVEGFMKYIGVPEWVALEKADAEILKNLIDGAVGRHDSGKTAETVDMLRERERINSRSAAELLGL